MSGEIDSMPSDGSRRSGISKPDPAIRPTQSLRTVRVGSVITEIDFSEPTEVFSIPTDERVLWIFDENTARFCTGGVIPKPAVILTAGESAKNWQSVETILAEAVRGGLGRDGRIVAVGGGVVCDLAAFAASVYLRGIAVTLVPTTVLSMVDASVGGKTGMDFMGTKNLVGTFYPADQVRICIGFVSTLPRREYHSGVAEVIKHALLGDRELYDFLRENRSPVMERNPAAVRLMVERSIALKGDVVERDFKESGTRMHLNLGHTFGHALESVTNFDLSHGECVAWGIGKAMQAGVEAGITDAQYAGQVWELLSEYGYTLRYAGASVDELLEAMNRDKKRAAGRVRFVLQEGFGRTVVTPLAPELVAGVLAQG